MQNVSKPSAEGQAQSCADRPTDPAPAWSYPMDKRFQDIESLLLAVYEHLGHALLFGRDAASEEPEMSIAGDRRCLEEHAADMLVDLAAVQNELREVQRELRERKIL